MSDQQFITIFYKYNRYALVIIILYVLVFGAFFYISMKMSHYISAVGFIVLILPPIIGAVRKKSIFSLRTWDTRRLVLTPAHIKVGEQEFSVSNLKIAIYVNGFEGFSYNRKNRNRWIARNSIYGDGNYLSFRSEKSVEDFQFYLKDYKAYLALYEVL